MRHFLATCIVALPILAMAASFYFWVRRESLSESRRQTWLSALLYLLLLIMMGWLASPYLMGDNELLNSARIYLPVNALANLVVATQILQCPRSLRHK
jgi:hypothetical protein